MTDFSKEALLVSFDGVRPAFLATIDQFVAGLRPALAREPEKYTGSLLSFARLFADGGLVREQFQEVASPEMMEGVTDEEMLEVHLVTVAYLLSLVIHETVRSSTPTHRGTEEEIP